MNRARGWWILCAAAVFAMPWLAVFAMRSGLTYPCPFKFLCGLPCPTCGATRSLAALASLDVLGSLRFNPLVLLGAPAALAGFASREHWPARRLGLPLFVAALLVNWVYLLIALP